MFVARPRNDGAVEALHEPGNAVVLASLGRAVGGVRRADRDLRESRRRGYQSRPRDLHPHRHRADQLCADPVRDRPIQPFRADLAKELDLPGAVGPRHRRLVAVLFSRAEARTGDAGGADRQIERGAGGAVRRGLSRRTALAQRLARHRPDRRGRGHSIVIQALKPQPTAPRRSRSARCRKVHGPTAAA